MRSEGTSLVRDPLYHPADSEIPPRLRPMFSDKRKLMLPSIIQANYVRAKSAFDRSDYKSAAEGFTEMLIALSDPDVAGPASRPPLSDLHVLALGFNDLAVKAMTPQPVTAVRANDARSECPERPRGPNADARDLTTAITPTWSRPSP